MTKSLAKILLVFASIVLVALFVIGIGQTIKLNALNSELANITQQNEDVENELDSIDEKLDYKESPSYDEDYLRQEEDYVEEGDKIYRQV